jgi:hypothetical protein
MQQNLTGLRCPGLERGQSLPRPETTGRRKISRTRNRDKTFFLPGGYMGTLYKVCPYVFMAGLKFFGQQAKDKQVFFVKEIDHG